MVRIASYNVENFFARPNAFELATWDEGERILQAYRQVNDLFNNDHYSDDNRREIRDLLVRLDVYYSNNLDAIRRKYSVSPRWAWFRRNRGSFDREPRDRSLNVEIIADGRANWNGWVELATSPTNDFSTRLQARVIRDVDADIIGIIEAEDRPSLVRFNNEFLNNIYSHIMLIDGNDERGIDVGIMTKNNFNIESIQSNIDMRDNTGLIFSRDCPQYTVRTPNGTIIHILLNHFKSQSGGGDEKRRRQAVAVRQIADNLMDHNQHVVVMGDLNEGPHALHEQGPNLVPLYDNHSRLVDCYTLDGFQTGERPGSFDSCTIRNRFDYIFISESLQPFFRGGEIFRRGLWGSNVNPAWEIYPELRERSSNEQASDHGAIVINLDI